MTQRQTTSLTILYVNINRKEMNDHAMITLQRDNNHGKLTHVPRETSIGTFRIPNHGSTCLQIFS